MRRTVSRAFGRPLLLPGSPHFARTSGANVIPPEWISHAWTTGGFSKQGGGGGLKEVVACISCKGILTAVGKGILMIGCCNKTEVFAHAGLIIRSFGWKVFWRMCGGRAPGVAGVDSPRGRLRTMPRTEFSGSKMQEGCGELQITEAIPKTQRIKFHQSPMPNPNAPTITDDTPFYARACAGIANALARAKKADADACLSGLHKFGDNRGRR